MRSLFTCLVALFVASAVFAAEKDKEGFTLIMDGKTFDGWKIGGPKESWKIEGGAFVANGKPSHLFYVGDEKPFKNFELKVDVMTEKNSNGGIYFHTKYQDRDWPRAGFETQVNNTFESDPRKTGSLYSVKDVMHDSPAKDNEWWEQYIIVKDNKVTIKVDGKTVMEYTEEPGRKAGKDFSRKLDEGTFALQAHDPGSTVRYKNIRVKRLD
jgi:3-keto-disaccharide hydrolase